MSSHLLVVHGIRKVLVNLIIMQQTRPAKDHAQVLIYRIRCPENTLRTLMSNVIRPLSKRRARLPVLSPMKAQRRDNLIRIAKGIPRLIHARGLQQIQHLYQASLGRLKARKAHFRIRELHRSAEQGVAFAERHGVEIVRAAAVFDLQFAEARYCKDGEDYRSSRIPDGCCYSVVMGPVPEHRS